jgi:DNA-binding XRE family transcriptional regulator
MLTTLNFEKVEVLRRHLMLTTTEMAEVFGVSRITYYNWVNGTPLRAKNLANAKKVIRKLVAVVKEYNWPTEEVRQLDQKQRLQRLLALLEQHT